MFEVFSFVLPSQTPLQEWPEYNAVLKKHPDAFEKPAKATKAKAKAKAEKNTAGQPEPSRMFNNVCFRQVGKCWQYSRNVNEPHRIRMYINDH